MASSSKKITYTNDFKLKVLDYYFKHGGDNSFGLKTKTAHHFNIDKKTINRMLNNPDIVKKARKLGAKKTVLTSAKSGGKNIGRNVKTIHKSSLTSKSSSGTGVSSSTTASKTSSHGSSSSVSGSTKHGSSTASSSTTSSGAKGGGGQGNKAALSSGKSGPSGPGRPSKTTNDDDIEVQVFELPEDPDYSVLKRSINTSTNGVAGISKLLVTGTPEVQNMLLNECDIIMECKVCRNLFRSVANFLAHKRIYCRETYSDVRSLFHKGETEGVTNQSGTVIVVPEPPSEEAEIAASTSSQHLSSSVQSTKPSGINNITASLVSSQKPQELSSSTGKGTSKYYEKILEVNKKRNLISQDCSVVLEDIAGVTNARFQSYNSKDPSSKSIKCIVDQIQQKSLGLTVVLNEHGQITKTAPGNAEIDDIRDELEEEEPQPPSLVCSICNTSFATRKTLSHHQRSLHGLDRAIFSCPLCKNNFLSMWATVKHLQRFHRKSTTYIQRVRNTIKERSRVKPIPKKLEKMKDQTDDSDEEEDEDEEEAIGKEKSEGLEQEVNVEKENQAMDQEKVEEKIYKVDTPKKDKEEMVKQSTPQSASSCAVSSDITGMSTAKDLGGGPVDSYCNNCERRFQTPLALSSHEKFCSLLQIRPDILPEGPLSPRLRAEQPKKKISIQIRKDYKKELSQEPLPSSVSESDSKGHMLFKVPKTPTGVEQPQKVDALISEFCNIDRLQCIPCEKRYQKVSTLKRHAALHFDWTRFVCVVCGFKKYNKYELMLHCNQDHNMDSNQAESSVREFEMFGPLRYFLKSSDSDTLAGSNSSKTATGQRPRSTSLSSVTVSSTNNDSSLDSKEKSGKEEVKCSDVVHSEESSCLDGSPSDFTFLGWDTKDILREKSILHLRSRSEPNICKSSRLSNENEDMRTERPHRARRFAERKDFIYELKRNLVPRSECKSKELRELTRNSEEIMKTKVNKRLSSPPPSNICKKSKQESDVANNTLYTETPVKKKSHSLQPTATASLYQNGVDRNMECMTVNEEKIPMVDTCVNTYREETTEIQKENTSNLDCVLDTCNGDKESPQGKITSAVVSDKESNVKDAHRLVWIDVDDKQREDKEIGKGEPMALQLAIKGNQ